MYGICVLFEEMLCMHVLMSYWKKIEFHKNARDRTVYGSAREKGQVFVDEVSDV